MIKAQVLAGGRGKGHFDSGLQGGVKLANRYMEVNEIPMKCGCVKNIENPMKCFEFTWQKPRDAWRFNDFMCEKHGL